MLKTSVARLTSTCLWFASFIWHRFRLSAADDALTLRQRRQQDRESAFEASHAELSAARARLVEHQRALGDATADWERRCGEASAEADRRARELDAETERRAHEAEAESGMCAGCRAVIARILTSNSNHRAFHFSSHANHIFLTYVFSSSS